MHGQHGESVRIKAHIAQRGEEHHVEVHLDDRAWMLRLQRASVLLRDVNTIM